MPNPMMPAALPAARLFACCASRPAPYVLRLFGHSIRVELLAIRAGTLDDAARLAAQHFAPDLQVTITESTQEPL